MAASDVEPELLPVVEGFSSKEKCLFSGVNSLLDSGSREGAAEFSRATALISQEVGGQVECMAALGKLSESLSAKVSLGARASREPANELATSLNSPEGSAAERGSPDD